MKKPNTKNVLMILIAVLLVGGAFLVAEYRNKQSKLIYDTVSIATTTEPAFIENSEDWKKILLATDKNSSSTVKDLTKSAEKLSDTDLLARDFFAQYMKLKQEGSSSDKLSQADLALQTANKIVLTKAKEYSESEISIKNDSSKDAIKQYGNDIGGIFVKYSVNSRDEAMIARDALQKKDSSILKELDPIIDSNKKILNSLLKLSIPQSTVKTHLKLVNTMSAIVLMDESFKKSALDPIAGIQGISLVLKNSADLIAVFKDIRDGLISNKITYTQAEGGYMFLASENI